MTTFLLVSIVLFVVWLAILLFANETRREQVMMSVVGLVISPGVLLIASMDYRGAILEKQSVIGIEDLIFAFSLFGIAAVIYQVLIGRHAHKLRGSHYKIHHVGHWIAHLVLVLGLWAFASLLLLCVFSLSSILSLIVGGLLVGMYIIADRHDLLMNALLSGIFTAALVFITEQLFFIRLFPLDAASFWRFDTLSTFIIGGVPIEEIMWAAVVGFTIGPLYEWLRRYELR
jgi:hypothetical protein